MAELDYQYLAGVVEKAKKGDSDSFAELYAATYRKQYLFAYNYLRDEFLAEDALQETYTNALKNLKSLKDPKLFVSWLNQINFRVCYNLNKKQQRNNAENTEDAQSEMESVSTGHNEPESKVVNELEKEYIMQQILALPFSESQVIFLHYYRNMKIEDIAYLMEISRSSVKRYLNSGRDRLGAVLKEWR